MNHRLDLRDGDYQSLEVGRAIDNLKALLATIQAEHRKRDEFHFLFSLEDRQRLDWGVLELLQAIAEEDGIGAQEEAVNIKLE